MCLWYKATNFRGIGGDCWLAAPSDFIRGISAGKLDSFRLRKETEFRFRKRRTRIRSQWFPLVADRRRLKCTVIYSGGSRPLDKGGWGGGSHPDSEIMEGDRSQKQFFSALRASFWSKNKGEGRAPRPPPLDPPLIYSHDCSKLNKTNILPAKISTGFLNFHSNFHV